MKEFLATPVGSFVRVFVGFVVAAAIAVAQTGDVHSLGSIDWWEATLAGAIGALVPVVIAWLNPADPRFGKGS